MRCCASLLRIAAVWLAATVACAHEGVTAPASQLPLDAIISTDGAHAAWRRIDGGGLWFAHRAGPVGAWSEPTELSIRGLVGKLVFSPDGRRIAFENMRGGYSTQDPGYWGPNRAYNWGYIAVVDLTGDRVVYVNPSFARDTDPRWSGNETVEYIRHVEGRADERLTSQVPLIQPHEPNDGGSQERGLLQGLLATPLLSQPVAAADGRSLAFAVRSARDRAIYFMRLGEVARKVADYPDDDGQELSSVAVSPNGDLVAYVRGGALNGRGEVPNPLSLISPPKRAVWLVATASAGSPRLIGEGDSPQFSPDGTRLVWRDSRGLASVIVGASTFAAGQVGPRESLLPGPVARVRFSPDSQQIVYERSSYIEVLDLRSGAQWAVAKPNDSADSDPAWSPDGRSIAFRRVTGKQQDPDGVVGYDGAFVSRVPWSILVVDPATHASRQVWQAHTGRGSAFYALDQDPTETETLNDQLLWSDNQQIAFVWERDGWRHLYAVSTRGGPARLLTPGDGEVEQAVVSLDHRNLIYSSNIGDLPRRHLATVTFTGSAPKSPVTTGENSQWTPVALAGGATAYIEAGWRTPPAVWIQSGSGTLTPAGAPAVSSDFPASQLVQPVAVSFPGTDGKQAYGQLFVPHQPSGCGIIYVHGGITRQMLLGFHYREAYSNLYELNQYLAMRGCAVLSVEYRSSIMRGYDFRNAPGWGNAGASEYRDVLGGAKYLQSRADLHVRKIGIYGLSWGGYLTAQALARNSDVFAAGFDMAGVHEFPRTTRRFSPVAFAGQWRSPVLIAAGDDDSNVDFNHSILLVRALQAQAPQVSVTEKVIPNEIHDLSLSFADLLDVYWSGSEFLLNHLAASAWSRSATRSSTASMPAE